MDEFIKNMTLDDVLMWIIKNSDDTDAMDKINKLTFSFTSKYKEWTND